MQDITITIPLKRYEELINAEQSERMKLSEKYKEMNKQIEDRWNEYNGTYFNLQYKEEKIKKALKQLKKRKNVFLVVRKFDDFDFLEDEEYKIMEEKVNELRNKKLSLFQRIFLTK